MKTFLSVFMLILSAKLFAQQYSPVNGKRIIDTAAFAEWNKLPLLSEPMSISSDGHYACYAVTNTPAGHKTLVIQAVEKAWKKEFIDAGNCEFTPDSKLAIMQSGDSVCLYSLENGQSQYLPGARDFRLFGLGGETCLSYETGTSAPDLVIRNISDGREQRFTDLTGHEFIKNDSFLVIQRKDSDASDSKVSWSLEIQDLSTGRNKVLLKGPAEFLDVSWNLDQNSFVYSLKNETDGQYGLHWYNMLSGADQLILETKEQVKDAVFDPEGTALAFWSSGGIWHYREGMKTAAELVNDRSPGIDSGLALDLKWPVEFNKDGRCILFFLAEKESAAPQPKTTGAGVDIWNYKDQVLQSQQLAELKHPLISSYAALVHIDEHKVIRIAQEGESGTVTELSQATRYVLESRQRGITSEWWWQKGDWMKTWLISLKDGSRKLLPISDILNLDGDASRSSNPGFFEQISPDEKYLLFYDTRTKSYKSYDISTQVVRDLTKGMDVCWEDPYFRLFPYPSPSVGVEYHLRNVRRETGEHIVWSKDGSCYLGDSYDIWKIDPSGRQKPVNITNGYGRSHHIIFSLTGDENSGKDEWQLSAYDPTNHNKGLYKQKIGRRTDPKCIMMGFYGELGITKAKNSDTWLIATSNTESPISLSITHDFRSFTTLREIHPAKDYNWYRSELVSWKLPDGQICRGTLFKPEDLDTTKKYPLIFDYYENMLRGPCDYITPEWMYATQLSIPYFVSRGYLVFTPDMYSTVGHPMKSALEVVVSAAKALSAKRYVDSKRMGLTGHSWGGYETNYIVTHSHLFAAAAEGAGGTDFISSYGGFFGDGSNQFNFEISQSRIGASLWARPDLYIENSPIFKADRVTTPLLILHNKADRNVAWGQGVELFTALRRLGKRCWMLQYDGETHDLSKEQNAHDYTIRLTQFFDHYLKGAPAPKWMVEGIPARLKGAEKGYELEPGKTP